MHGPDWPSFGFVVGHIMLRKAWRLQSDADDVNSTIKDQLKMERIASNGSLKGHLAFGEAFHDGFIPISALGVCSKPVLNACRRELGNRRSVSEEDVPVQEAVDRLVEEFVNSDALEDAMSDGNFYVKLNALTNMADLPGYRGEENQAKVSEALELAQRWSSPITGVLVPADSSEPMQEVTFEAGGAHPYSSIASVLGVPMCLQTLVSKKNHDSDMEINAFCALSKDLTQLQENVRCSWLAADRVRGDAFIACAHMSFAEPGAFKTTPFCLNDALNLQSSLRPARQFTGSASDIVRLPMNFSFGIWAKYGARYPLRLLRNAISTLHSKKRFPDIHQPTEEHAANGAASCANGASSSRKVILTLGGGRKAAACVGAHPVSKQAASLIALHALDAEAEARERGDLADGVPSLWQKTCGRVRSEMESLAGKCPRMVMLRPAVGEAPHGEIAVQAGVKSLTPELEEAVLNGPGSAFGLVWGDVWCVLPPPKWEWSGVQAMDPPLVEQRTEWTCKAALVGDAVLAIGCESLGNLLVQGASRIVAIESGKDATAWSAKTLKRALEGLSQEHRPEVVLFRGDPRLLESTQLGDGRFAAAVFDPIYVDGAEQDDLFGSLSHVANLADPPVVAISAYNIAANHDLARLHQEKLGLDEPPPAEVISENLGLKLNFNETETVLKEWGAKKGYELHVEAIGAALSSGHHPAIGAKLTKAQHFPTQEETQPMDETPLTGAVPEMVFHWPRQAPAPAFDSLHGQSKRKHIPASTA